jgi:hypothetical protein
MSMTFKELTAYFVEAGADQVSYTDKTYLAMPSVYTIHLRQGLQSSA